MSGIKTVQLALDNYCLSILCGNKHAEGCLYKIIGLVREKWASEDWRDDGENDRSGKSDLFTKCWAENSQEDGGQFHVPFKRVHRARFKSRAKGQGGHVQGLSDDNTLSSTNASRIKPNTSPFGQLIVNWWDHCSDRSTWFHWDWLTGTPDGIDGFHVDWSNGSMIWRRLKRVWSHSFTARMTMSMMEIIMKTVCPLFVVWTKLTLTLYILSRSFHWTIPLEQPSRH